MRLDGLASELRELADMVEGCAEVEYLRSVAVRVISAYMADDDDALADAIIALEDAHGLRQQGHA